VISLTGFARSAYWKNYLTIPYFAGYAESIVGLISAKAAFTAYAVLGVLAGVTLEGQSRLITLALLALFAVKTYVDILRRRMAAREAEEASAAAPPRDVGPGRES
jgi:hypothetical protein